MIEPPPLASAQDVMDALQHFFPEGFDAFDGADPTPTSYAEYVEWTQTPPLTEAEMRAGAEATRTARAARAAHAGAPVASPRQIRLALIRSGVPLASIEAALAGDPEALVEWEYALHVPRNHPLVAALAAAMGLDDAAVDALFSLALSL